MRTVSATEARQHFFEMVKNTVGRHDTYQIHHPKGDAVLMSVEEYDNLVETLELLSIPKFRESIKRSIGEMEKGETVSMEQVFGDDSKKK